MGVNYYMVRCTQLAFWLGHLFGHSHSGSLPLCWVSQCRFLHRVEVRGEIRLAARSHRNHRFTSENLSWLRQSHGLLLLSQWSYVNSFPTNKSWIYNATYSVLPWKLRAATLDRGTLFSMPSSALKMYLDHLGPGNAYLLCHILYLEKNTFTKSNGFTVTEPELHLGILATFSWNLFAASLYWHHICGQSRDGQTKHQGLGVWVIRSTTDLLGEELMNFILNLQTQWHMFHLSIKINTQALNNWLIDLDFGLSWWKKVEARLQKTRTRGIK